MVPVTPHEGSIISIHAPLTGSDYICSLSLLMSTNFNPRSPYGERRSHTYPLDIINVISIHAPLTGSDCFFYPGKEIH